MRYSLIRPSLHGLMNPLGRNAFLYQLIADAIKLVIGSTRTTRHSMPTHIKELLLTAPVPVGLSLDLVGDVVAVDNNNGNHYY